MSKQSFGHCPLLNKKCIEHKCSWYVQVHGQNPQTGDTVSEWQCSVALLPLLLIENSKQQRSTSAAVESFRNETIKQTEVTNNLLFHVAQVQQPVLSKVQDVTFLPPD